LPKVGQRDRRPVAVGPWPSATRSSMNGAWCLEQRVSAGVDPQVDEVGGGGVSLMRWGSEQVGAAARGGTRLGLIPDHQPARPESREAEGALPRRIEDERLRVQGSRRPAVGSTGTASFRLANPSASDVPSASGTIGCLELEHGSRFWRATLSAGRRGRTRTEPTRARTAESTRTRGCPQAARCRSGRPPVLPRQG
jgi:hypothetical protein